MGRKKGSLKTGGRQKGTPNKKSLIIEEAFLNEGIDVGVELARMFNDSINKDEKLKILFKVMDFIYPKRKSEETLFESVEVQTPVFQFVECSENEQNESIDL